MLLTTVFFGHLTITEAVGLPTPWSAAAPVSSVVQGHLAPTMHASGQASSGLWACLVAGAGAVGQNIRQNREPRRRQARARRAEGLVGSRVAQASDAHGGGRGGGRAVGAGSRRRMADGERG